MINYFSIRIKQVNILERRGGQLWREVSLHSNRDGNTLFERGIWLRAFIVIFIIIPYLCRENK